MSDPRNRHVDGTAPRGDEPMTESVPDDVDRLDDVDDPSGREIAAARFRDAAEAAERGNDHAVVDAVNHARLALREARRAERDPERVTRWERGP